MSDADDRAAGALLGLACGDALGRPVAGWSGAEIASQHGRLDEMRAGGPDGRPAGATTGVTARVLRAAGSLAETDLGLATAPGPDAADAAPPVDGVPVGIACRDAPDRIPAVVSRLPTADGDERATAATAALARVVGALVDGASPDEALDGALTAAADRDAPPAVRTTLAAATDGATTAPGEGPVGTLETALHDGLTAHAAEAAAVAAVNRGGETTAAGAAAGAISGARFGADALPDRWLDSLDGDPLREAARALVAGPVRR